jgi:hypothetical protein
MTATRLLGVNFHCTRRIQRFDVRIRRSSVDLATGHLHFAMKAVHHWKTAACDA